MTYFWICPNIHLRVLVSILKLYIFNDFLKTYLKYSKNFIFFNNKKTMVQGACVVPYNVVGPLLHKQVHYFSFLYIC